jgi:hypothetical protein
LINHLSETHRDVLQCVDRRSESLLRVATNSRFQSEPLDDLGELVHGKVGLARLRLAKQQEDIEKTLLCAKLSKLRNHVEKANQHVLEELAGDMGRHYAASCSHHRPVITPQITDSCTDKKQSNQLTNTVNPYHGGIH